MRELKKHGRRLNSGSTDTDVDATSHIDKYQDSWCRVMMKMAPDGICAVFLKWSILSVLLPSVLKMALEVTSNDSSVVECCR